MTMFDKAGGVDKVNQEAQVVFDQFGTNETKSLSESVAKDFPAIAALGGDSVVLLGQSSDMASEIAIRFGGHWHTKFIHIFPPNFNISEATNFTNVSAFLDESNYFQITTNIFVQR